VRHAPQGGLFTWALFDRDPLSRWSSGPVVLAGDAAHPMLPFLGLGAALGLEDAVVLARSLERHALGPFALERYEAARVARCASALRDSRTQGELYQAADPEHYGAAGRGAELRLPYFAYDASTVPL
jgi:salicylate hydroxylase